MERLAAGEPDIFSRAVSEYWIFNHQVGRNNTYCTTKMLPPEFHHENDHKKVNMSSLSLSLCCDCESASHFLSSTKGVVSDVGENELQGC